MLSLRGVISPHIQSMGDEIKLPEEVALEPIPRESGHSSLYGDIRGHIRTNRMAFI